ncbi:MAG: polymer-forming cytoskeletal protein [bacterium]|nr:polymer-forming cytoskeletal protein [bacterium]
MGLFGRDDRPSPQTPSTTPAVPPRRDTAKPSAPAHAKTTLLSRATSFEGAISGAGDVTIEGKLKGSVRISGRLIVADNGTANASLHGKTVLVSGKVKGDVTADEKIELQASARLNGNITAPRILIHEGAIFEGQVVMQNPEKEKPVDAQRKNGAGPNQSKKGNSGHKGGR